MARRFHTPYKTVDEVCAAFSERRIPTHLFLAHVRAASERERLRSAGLPQERPPRRMPSMKSILRYLNFPPHVCFKCMGEFDYLERAHVIDRIGGGLDVEPNLRPLCPQCHRLQPAFFNGEEERAAEWFSVKRSPLLDIMEGAARDRR